MRVAPPPAKVSLNPPPFACAGPFSGTSAPRGTLPYSELAVWYSGWLFEVRFFHARYLEGGKGGKSGGRVLRYGQDGCGW